MYQRFGEHYLGSNLESLERECRPRSGAAYSEFSSMSLLQGIELANPQFMQTFLALELEVEVTTFLV